MEFATLDKMLEKLEEEKKAYVKRMDEQLKELRACVEKMRSDYRNETMPKATGMVEYMLERAKKRFRNLSISQLKVLSRGIPVLSL